VRYVKYFVLGVAAQAALKGKIFEGVAKSVVEVEVIRAGCLEVSERGATCFQSFSGQSVHQVNAQLVHVGHRHHREDRFGAERLDCKSVAYLVLFPECN
jgi:hypothetical protein